MHWGVRAFCASVSAALSCLAAMHNQSVEYVLGLKTSKFLMLLTVITDEEPCPLLGTVVCASSISN